MKFNAIFANTLLDILEKDDNPCINEMERTFIQNYFRYEVDQVPQKQISKEFEKDDEVIRDIIFNLDTPKKRKEALQKEMDKGNICAYFYYGNMMCLGMDSLRDIPKGLEYLIYAASHHHPYAQQRLGELHYNGKYPPQYRHQKAVDVEVGHNVTNHYLSFFWFMLASVSGLDRARNALASRYTSGGFNVLYYLDDLINILEFGSNNGEMISRIALIEIYVDEHSPKYDMKKVISLVEQSIYEGHKDRIERVLKKHGIKLE